MAALGLIIAVVFLGGLTVFFVKANPIVVTDSCGEKIFHEGKREQIKITDEDVKAFIVTWISLRYTWKEYDPDKISKSIAPLSTDGLQEKLNAVLGRQKAQNSAPPGSSPASSQDQRTQKIEESVTNIEVTLTEHDALASFDRIVRINGIPVILPSQVSLQIVQGAATRWNRLGLYVNGIIERENR